MIDKIKLLGGESHEKAFENLKMGKTLEETLCILVVYLDSPADHPLRPEASVIHSIKSAGVMHLHYSGTFAFYSIIWQSASSHFAKNESSARQLPDTMAKC